MTCMKTFTFKFPAAISVAAATILFAASCSGGVSTRVSNGTIPPHTEASDWLVTSESASEDRRSSESDTEDGILSVFGDVSDLLDGKDISEKHADEITDVIRRTDRIDNLCEEPIAGLDVTENMLSSQQCAEFLRSLCFAAPRVAEILEINNKEFTDRDRELWRLSAELICYAYDQMRLGSLFLDVMRECEQTRDADGCTVSISANLCNLAERLQDKSKHLHSEGILDETSLEASEDFAADVCDSPEKLAYQSSGMN